MRIVVTSESNRGLIEMFMASIERTKDHKDYNNPYVVTG